MATGANDVRAVIDELQHQANSALTDARDAEHSAEQFLAAASRKRAEAEAFKYAVEILREIEKPV